MTFSELIEKHPELAEEAEERAGIIEVCGEHSREKAEELTVTILIHKYGLHYNHEFKF